MLTDVPNSGQLHLLGATVGFFAAGGVFSLARFKTGTNGFRLASKICLYTGIAFGIGVLVWHSQSRGSWIPLEDNFDTLVWLALLLSLFVAYTQRTRPLRGLDWFVMPIVILLLIAAAVFGRTTPHEYLDTTWSWVHRVTAYGGALAFAVGGAVGAMYLIAQRRLRTKRVAPGEGLGSLERLEHLTLLSVTLGFALLTIGLITGLVKVLKGGNPLGPDWYTQPKVLLTCIAWVVYALVLHSPINPSFRGRRTALLSVVGFVLMIGVLIAVQLMPAAK
ncbi:MAG TPA: cytochrome c biogenesis protein CcsA [Tepidisphaeraceae bacterium]|nr:cytochrome c biogenesis protein CcsA [Tepidisphaeraceae bacterium]